MAEPALKLVKQTLEDHIPGWSDKLLKLRRETRQYEAEKADAAMVVKELKLQESRLLRQVEAIAEALQTGDRGALDLAVQQYHQS